MPNTTVEELLSLNQQLLESIAAGDWATYQRLCDPSLTAFEPEALGHLVEGMAFHQFYFGLKPSPTPSAHVTTTMVAPKVRLMDDVAIITYVRLVQRLDGQQNPVTTQCEETRVWQKQSGGWRHVHFHRSRNADA
jgi:hypothetical protein